MAEPDCPWCGKNWSVHYVGTTANKSQIFGCRVCKINWGESSYKNVVLEVNKSPFEIPIDGLEIIFEGLFS